MSWAGKITAAVVREAGQGGYGFIRADSLCIDVRFEELELRGLALTDPALIGLPVNFDLQGRPGSNFATQVERHPCAAPGSDGARIRPPGPGDGGEIEAIAAYEEVGPVWELEDFKAWINAGGNMIVVERAGRIVGFVAYRVNGQTIEVGNLAVDTACRRRGFGRALVRAMVNSLSEERGEFVQAWVAEGNVAAQLFFNSLGFVADTIVRAEVFNARRPKGERQATQDSLFFRYPPAGVPLTVICP